MTYICTGSARKKNMLARHVHAGLRDVFQRVSWHVLVAISRWCRRSVAVFQAEEAIQFDGARGGARLAKVDRTGGYPKP